MVAKAEKDIIAGTLHPFQGPLKDNAGKERVAAGKTMTDDEMQQDGLLRRRRAGQRCRRSRLRRRSGALGRPAPRFVGQASPDAASRPA